MVRKCQCFSFAFQVKHTLFSYSEICTDCDRLIIKTLHLTVNSESSGGLLALLLTDLGTVLRYVGKYYSERHAELSTLVSS